MVHPSELLRSNSNEGRSFSAPRIEYHLDCGLTNLPILNRCCNLERFATPRVFLVFLSLVGLLQGVTLTYFRETSKIWGRHYNVRQEHIDWLIYVNEFFVGIIGLVTSHHGNRLGRISWIGGLTIFQSISSALLLVPEIYRKGYLKDETTVNDLCPQSPTEETGAEINYIAIAVLCIFQVIYAMASVSFITHGITYLDDNSTSKNPAQFVGIALACREVGRHAGLYFSWIPNYLKNVVFVSPVWLTLASLTLVIGIIISMFPRVMFSTMVNALSASLMDMAAGHPTITPPPKIDGFFKILIRLLKNKILMVNIFSAVFIQAGLVNFNIFERFFKQSRFQISQLNDSSYTQLTTNILKQPLVAISLIAVGFIVAKTRPRLKNLIGWNIAAIILVLIFFGSTAFLKCEPNTKYEEMIHGCDHCHCGNVEFHPVCANSKTYFSPCHAGCRNPLNNFQQSYSECDCAKGPVRDGPCDQEICNIYYALSQINAVFTTAMLATTFVTNIVINMKCVKSTDKPNALGLEVTLTALITYLPVKAIYGAIAEQNCVYPVENTGHCKLYSKKLATYFAICTIIFILVSLILEIVAYFLLQCQPIEEKDEQEVSQVELEQMNRNQAAPAGGVNSGSANSMSESLLEMENVGDDHDSLDSAPFLGEPQNRVNPTRLLESPL